MNTQAEKPDVPNETGAQEQPRLFDGPITARPLDALQRATALAVIERVEREVARLKQQFGSEANPMDCDVVDLLAMLSPLEIQWPAHLRTLFEVVVAALRHAPAGSDIERQASAVVLAIAEYMGGEKIYLPTNDNLRRAVRNVMIYRLAGKVRAKDLARRFGLTETAVFEIQEEQRQLVVRRLQGKLFD
jgi:Mor family transcriptional regulator